MPAQSFDIRDALSDGSRSANDWRSYYSPDTNVTTVTVPTGSEYYLGVVVGGCKELPPSDTAELRYDL